jgi:diguanylate cyclase (GGDEF)-like protein
MDNDSGKKEKKMKGVSITAIISFLVSLSFCTFLISAAIVNKESIEKMRIEQHIIDISQRITETITKLLYKTEMLSTIIVLDSGSTDSFEFIAPSIIDDPAIQNVLLAPNGIVTKIFPYQENSNLIGWNYFDDKAGNREAMMAVELGELVLGGPINIVQGGSAVFGRLPVYIDTPEEKHKFWGIVSVTLKFPSLLDYFELNILDTYGSAYELWRTNPDTNEKQVMEKNNYEIKPDSSCIEKSIQIHNAEWFIKVSLIKIWYTQLENIVLIFAGLLISLVIFFVMNNNYKLKSIQSVFEQMAITDSLTGIFNRRHFMEIVRISIEKARREKEECYLIMFDIDKFKDVNDTHGHQIGDKVLMEITERIKIKIRIYDLFARYGGEEFIIFISHINKKKVCEIGERLRESLSSAGFIYDDVSLNCTASFGIAKMYDYDLDKAIRQSDEALYSAKRNGRNCVFYYGEKNPYTIENVE